MTLGLLVVNFDVPVALFDVFRGYDTLHMGLRLPDRRPDAKSPR
jgi:hypothetical protein